MTQMDNKTDVGNAPRAKPWTIPPLLLKGIGGFFLGGILLALIVPPLHRRGVSIGEWMALGVIGLSIAVCVAPDLYGRWRRRRSTL